MGVWIFNMGRLQILCLLAPLVVGDDDGAVVDKRNVHHTSQHGHTHIQFGNSGVRQVAAPVALDAASPVDEDADSFGKEEDREGKQLLLLPAPTPPPTQSPPADPECKMLQCDSVDGPIDDPAECPGGEMEICVETLETECSSVTSQQCQDYQETECAVSPKEVCITADQTTCTDTEFETACTETNEQCQSVETQKCGDPTPEDVCAEVVQVSCEPEEITLCKTTVSGSATSASLPGSARTSRLRNASTSTFPARDTSASRRNRECATLCRRPIATTPILNRGARACRVRSARARCRSSASVCPRWSL